MQMVKIKCTKYQMFPYKTQGRSIAREGAQRPKNLLSFIMFFIILKLFLQSALNLLYAVKEEKLERTLRFLSIK